MESDEIAFRIPDKTRKVNYCFGICTSPEKEELAKRTKKKCRKRQIAQGKYLDFVLSDMPA